MLYAVAYTTLFDNDIVMDTFEADNPVVALLEGVRQLSGSGDDDQFINTLLDADYLPDTYGEDIEEIKEVFFDRDCLVAVIPL